MLAAAEQWIRSVCGFAKWHQNYPRMTECPGDRAARGASIGNAGRDGNAPGAAAHGRVGDDLRAGADESVGSAGSSC